MYLQAELKIKHAKFERSILFCALSARLFFIYTLIFAPILEQRYLGPSSPWI